MLAMRKPNTAPNDSATTVNLLYRGPLLLPLAGAAEGEGGEGVRLGLGLGERARNLRAGGRLCTWVQAASPLCESMSREPC